jgi:imidazolonepropionase-like amidohydrolase
MSVVGVKAFRAYSAGKARGIVVCVAIVVTGCFPTRSAPTLVIEHVAVVDVVAGKIQPDQTIVLAGSRIASVSRSRSSPTSSGAIDGTGKFVIPGLWDMHVHLGKSDLGVLVAYGVTGARDMGGDFEEIRGWQREIEGGSLIGPRLVAAGPALVGSPATNSTSRRLVMTPADATHAVDSLARLGVNFIKVHEGLPRDTYYAIASEAKLKGLSFVGHVPASITPLEASDAGQRSIEHLEFIPDKCLLLFDEKTIAGLQPVPNECDHAHLAALLDHFAANKTWLDPTISMFRAYVSPAAYKALFAGFRAITPLIRQRGIPILVGSDLDNHRMRPGLVLHDEMRLLVESGFEPIEVLRGATSDALSFLGLADSLGTVAPGKIADLVLIDGDPLKDISNTQRISAVIKNGRFLTGKVLDSLRVPAPASDSR